MTDIWKRSRVISEAIIKYEKLSIRQIGEQTGISKSSVYRQLQALLKRNQHPESEFWETEAGRKWLCRLVFAVLYEFCIKSGVGVERSSDFFKRIRIETHVGVSPTALRTFLKNIEELIIEYQRYQEKEQLKTNKSRELIAAGDETFFKDKLLLVLMDLSSGYLLLEEEADNRSYDTWIKKTQARLDQIGVTIRHFVSDRAKALIKLGTDGFGCDKTGADLFHGEYEISKWLGIQVHRQLAQAKKKFDETKVRLTKLGQRNKKEDCTQKEQVVLEQQEECLQDIQTAHDDYHTTLQKVSLAVHPFNVGYSQEQSADDVESTLHNCSEKFKEVADSLSILDSRNALNKFNRQIEDISSIVTVWWIWVRENLIQYKLDKVKQEWLIHLLLPVIYWSRQMERTKHPSLKGSYKKAWQKALAAYKAHPLSQTLNSDEIEYWQKWANWMIGKFQRSSSAVEGRNGWLSQMYRNVRAFTAQRLKALTAIHNFDLRRSDGTSAAERLFDEEFPDLFEWALERIGPLPMPRKARIRTISNPLILQDCPALSG